MCMCACAGFIIFCHLRENRTCFDLCWHDNGTVLEYKTSVVYSFDATKSNGHPDTDRVTTINMPLIVRRGRGWVCRRVGIV